MIKKSLKKARSKIVSWKIYLDRAKMYINYINFLMIIIVFIDTLKNYKIFNNFIQNSSTGLIIFIPLFLLITIILGWLDTKLGIRSEEARQNSLKNPINNEIIDRLKNIEEKIK